MSARDHSWIDDTFDDDDRALAGRLATVLADRAGALVVADEPFDPTRPSTLDQVHPAGPGRTTGASLAPVPGGGADGGNAHSDAASLDALPITGAEGARRAWVVWVAGAAAAAVLVAAIVAINAVRQPSLRTGEDPALLAPDTAWSPTWVPDGLELWSLQTEHGDPRSIIAAVSSADLPVTVVQLLESSTSGAKILVGIRSEGAEAPVGTPITIRGVSGAWAPEPTREAGTPAGTSLRWVEAGAVFDATVRGLDRAAAVELLDRLVLSDPVNPMRGFASPPDSSWTLHTDDPRVRPETDVVVGSFGYDRGRPTGGRLPLQVVTSGGGSAVSGFPGYLSVAFLGSMGDDGVARAFTPSAGDRPAESYTAWPDGRSVYSSGIDLDEASATRIADSIEPMTRQQLERRADEVSAKLGSAEVLAKADLPSGTVEVVGDGEPSAICLTLAERRVCRTSESLAGAGARLMGSVIIDGTWYVFAASDDGPVELGVGTSGSMVGSGTAVATTIATDDEVSVEPAVPVPTSEAPAVDVEVVIGEVPAGPGPGPGSSTSLPPTGSTFDGGMTTGTGPPDRSVPFESAVVGSWTLALLVAPADADAAWASFPNNMITFPRPSA